MSGHAEQPPELELKEEGAGAEEGPEPEELEPEDPELGVAPSYCKPMHMGQVSSKLERLRGAKQDGTARACGCCLGLTYQLGSTRP